MKEKPRERKTREEKIKSQTRRALEKQQLEKEKQQLEKQKKIIEELRRKKEKAKKRYQKSLWQHFGIFTSTLPLSCLSSLFIGGLHYYVFPKYPKGIAVEKTINDLGEKEYFVTDFETITEQLGELYYREPWQKNEVGNYETHTYETQDVDLIKQLEESYQTRNDKSLKKLLEQLDKNFLEFPQNLTMSERMEQFQMEFPTLNSSVMNQYFTKDNEPFLYTEITEKNQKVLKTKKLTPEEIKAAETKNKSCSASWATIALLLLITISNFHLCEEHYRASKKTCSRKRELDYFQK